MHNHTILEEVWTWRNKQIIVRWIIDTNADDFFLIIHFHNFILFERHLLKLHLHLLANISSGSILI